jgi:hypothetical protein
MVQVVRTRLTTLYEIQVVMTSWITSMFDSKECSQVTKVTHCPRGIYY